MPSPPLVSVIIPSYNGARFLPETLRSALQQTHPKVEVIVVDDGSTDDTPAVIARFGGAVQYVRQENSGVSAARNRGIGLAKGEYIAFLDADDVWLPAKLERQLRAFENTPALGAVGCWSRTTDAELNVIEEQIPSSVELEDLLLFRSNGGLNCSTMIVRSEVLREIGLFDLRLSTSADWDLVARIARRHPVTVIPESLMLYRQHGGSMHLGIRRMEKDALLALGKAFQEALPPNFARLRRRAYSNLYCLLAGSYWHTADALQAIRCGMRSFLWHPTAIFVHLATLPVRRLRARGTPSCVP